MEKARRPLNAKTRRHISLIELQNGYPQYGRQRRCRAEGQFRTATATGERAALPAKQKFAPKPAKLKAAPLQQGQRSGFGHQYLRLRAASAFFLRFTLGFS